MEKNLEHRPPWMALEEDVLELTGLADAVGAVAQAVRSVDGAYGDGLSVIGGCLHDRVAQTQVNFNRCLEWMGVQSE